MAEWVYDEKKILRLYMRLLFISGEVFCLAVFSLLLRGTLRNDPRFDPEDLLLVILFMAFWTITGFYFLSNSPQSLVLNDETIQICWRKNQRKSYLWRDVDLKKIGLNPIPMIFINDKNWRVFNLRVLRVVMLDGWSKRYKELVKKIEFFKSERHRCN